MRATISTSQAHLGHLHKCKERLQEANADLFETNKDKTGEAKKALDALKEHEWLLAEEAAQRAPRSHSELIAYVNVCNMYLRRSQPAFDKCKSHIQHDQAEACRQALREACDDADDTGDLAKRLQNDIKSVRLVLSSIGVVTLNRSLDCLEDCVAHHCVEQKIRFICEKLAATAVERVCGYFRVDEAVVLDNVLSLMSRGAETAQGMLSARFAEESAAVKSTTGFSTPYAPSPALPATATAASTTPSALVAPAPVSMGQGSTAIATPATTTVPDPASGSDYEAFLKYLPHTHRLVTKSLLDNAPFDLAGLPKDLLEVWDQAFTQYDTAIVRQGGRGAMWSRLGSKNLRRDLMARLSQRVSLAGAGDGRYAGGRQ